MASQQNLLHSTISHTSSINNNNKRRKITHNNQSIHLYSPNLFLWRSHSQQRIYSSNLLHALRRSPPSPAARQLRHTADRILARTAKGTTRWSRAILSSPRWKKLQRNNKLKKVKKPGITGGDRKRKRRLPALEKKARVLSRLVPGCKKVSFQNLLEEASDYISALEMQVRAMTALTMLLDGGTVS